MPYDMLCTVVRLRIYNFVGDRTMTDIKIKTRGNGEMTYKNLYIVFAWDDDGVSFDAECTVYNRYTMEDIGKFLTDVEKENISMMIRDNI